MAAMLVASDLELRIGQDPVLIRAAQELRYRVFFEEMGAIPDPHARHSRCDSDRFDALADHLVVLDRRRSTRDRPKVVGCYRLLRGSIAGKPDGFYSAAEFDLAVFHDRLATVVELGRSCVDPDYRNGAVMQLLWRGVAQYLERHGLETMLGCASLPGTDLERLAPSLAYLGAFHLAPETIRPRAVPARCVPLPAVESFNDIDLRRGKSLLPPLLKAYLRMGGLVGEGAVVDASFNTVDVCLVLPTALLKDRYLRHLAMPERSDAVAA